MKGICTKKEVSCRLSLFKAEIRSLRIPLYPSSVPQLLFLDKERSRCNGFCLLKYKVDRTICFIGSKEPFRRSRGHFIFVMVCLMLYSPVLGSCLCVREIFANILHKWKAFFESTNGRRGKENTRRTSDTPGWTL